MGQSRNNHGLDDTGVGCRKSLPALQNSDRLEPTTSAGKDWTDARQAGVDLRRWWIEEWLAEAFDREERAAIQEFDASASKTHCESR
jgi:hypothetical protein